MPELTENNYVKTRLEEGINLIPYHMRDGVRRYVLDGIPGGSFMNAVFANDLMQAMGKADLDNREAMFNWTCFIYNHVPRGCHGSYEIVENWKGIRND